VPHNPRRQRVQDATDPALTGERIAAALDRASALRRKTAIDPDDVRIVPLNVSKATQSTENRRAPVDWDRPAERDPWVLVGWVKLERGWGFTDRYGWDRYDRTWEVWLNVDDDRVWLKLGRWSCRPKDDPLP
jgi:hypothetical protein